MDRGELSSRFTYHSPDGSKKLLHETVRENTRNLAFWMNNLLPEGREKTLAMTKLEEAMFWANAAIARN